MDYLMYAMLQTASDAEAQVLLVKLGEIERTDTENFKVAYTYAVRSHPDHFFINRKGEFVGKTVGARDWQSAKNRDLIRYLLDQNDGK